jgi:hypothetical protein
MYNIMHILKENMRTFSSRMEAYRNLIGESFFYKHTTELKM